MPRLSKPQVWRGTRPARSKKEVAVRRATPVLRADDAIGYRENQLRSDLPANAVADLFAPVFEDVLLAAFDEQAGFRLGPGVAK